MEEKEKLDIMLNVCHRFKPSCAILGMTPEDMLHELIIRYPKLLKLNEGNHINRQTSYRIIDVLRSIGKRGTARDPMMYQHQ